MFEGLKLVITFSRHLLSSLEAEIGSRASFADEEVKVGACLIDYVDEMRMVYAKYLQNHASVANLVKNV